MGGTWLVPERRVAALPSDIPDTEGLRLNRHEATVTWIGHSTLLVQLDGVNFLTDPTWASRSGPFRGAIGVRRYTPPPMRLGDLPPIDFVLISHDHYDHLDEATVVQLAKLKARGAYQVGVPTSAQPAASCVVQGDCTSRVAR